MNPHALEGWHLIWSTLLKELAKATLHLTHGSLWEAERVHLRTVITDGKKQGPGKAFMPVQRERDGVIRSPLPYRISYLSFPGHLVGSGGGDEDGS
jgi:hypothetical protein